MLLSRDNVCFRLLRNCLADHQNRQKQRERSTLKINELKKKLLGIFAKSKRILKTLVREDS